MLIKFQKENNEWLAVLPDYPGPKEDLQMVGGADDWLDIISEGEISVILELSDKGFPGSYMLTRELTSPKSGAIYNVGKYKGIDYSHKNIWLRPVIVFIFGEYPKTIHYL